MRSASMARQVRLNPWGSSSRPTAEAPRRTRQTARRDAARPMDALRGAACNPGLQTAIGASIPRCSDGARMSRRSTNGTDSVQRAAAIGGCTSQTRAYKSPSRRTRASVTAHTSKWTSDFWASDYGSEPCRQNAQLGCPAAGMMANYNAGRFRSQSIYLRGAQTDLVTRLSNKYGCASSCRCFHSTLQSDRTIIWEQSGQLACARQ